MEKVLLDTNILLVAVIKPDALPIDIQQQLTDPTCTVFFSPVSIWEIAIKRSLSKESFDFEPEDIYELALETGFTELLVASRHCFSLTRMAWHHRDPFDRLLVSQAQSIPAYLFTTDGVLEKYSELVKKISLRTVLP